MKLLVVLFLLVTLPIQAEQVARIKLEQLTKEHCDIVASNIQSVSLLFVKSLFMKDCVGKAVSVVQQVEQPEMPNYYNYSMVTINDFGNVPYAVKYPNIFFGYGQFNFSDIVAKGKEISCQPQVLKALVEEKAEIVTRFTVNDLLVYDVRFSYGEMGVASIRYYLNGDRDDPEYYPVRHDFNFRCEE